MVCRTWSNGPLFSQETFLPPDLEGHTALPGTIDTPVKTENSGSSRENTVPMQQLVWFKDLGWRWPFRPGDPQAPGHRLAPVRGRSGTRWQSKRWAASEEVSPYLRPLPAAHTHTWARPPIRSAGALIRHVLESSRNHPPSPRPWKNCLPWKPVTINVSHDHLYLEGHLGPCLDLCSHQHKLLLFLWTPQQRAATVFILTDALQASFLEELTENGK